MEKSLQYPFLLTALLIFVWAERRVVEAGRRGGEEVGEAAADLAALAFERPSMPLPPAVRREADRSSHAFLGR